MGIRRVRTLKYFQVKKRMKGGVLQAETSFKTFIKDRRVILGLAFRLAIAPFVSHQYDMTIFASIARLFYMQGVAAFFIKWPFTTYFPIWSYPILSYLLLIASYFPVRLLPWDVTVFHQNVTVAEEFFIKFPLILSDLITAYILFLFAHKNGIEKYAMPLALAYWFNPLTLYISALHGTFSSVENMLAMAAFYHFTRERYALASVELMLGAAIKYQVLLLLPPLLVILWRNKKRELPAFLIMEIVLFTAIFVIPRMIQQIPYLNLWVFQPTTSRIIIEPGVFDMNYYSLLARTELSPYVVDYCLGSLSVIASLGVFAVIFTVITYLMRNEGVIELPSQVAYIVGTYMAFYLSYGQIHHHYASWAIPFLLLLLSYGKIQRNLFVIYNVTSMIHGFLRNTVFTYINWDYFPYGESPAGTTATGILFSIICLIVLQAIMKEQILKYRVPSKIEDFFTHIPLKTRQLMLYATLALTFITIVTMLNVNGVYWHSAPIMPFSPQEFRYLELHDFLPRDRELILLYLAVTLIVPLPLALTLPKQETEQYNIVREAKIMVPLILLALVALVILTILVLNSTLTYVGLLKLINYLICFHGFSTWDKLLLEVFLVYANMPPGGFLMLAHGGMMTTLLGAVITILLVLTITPIVNDKEVIVKTSNET